MSDPCPHCCLPDGEHDPICPARRPLQCIHCGQEIRERTREPGTYEHAKTRATWCYNSTVATPPVRMAGPITAVPEVPVGTIAGWLPDHPIAEGWAFLDGTVEIADYPALAAVLPEDYGPLPEIPGCAIRVAP